MFAVFFLAAAVEISGPDVELCTQSVRELFAVMDERAEALDEATRPSTRMNRTFSESRGGARVERYNKEIKTLRQKLEEQQCTVRFVHDDEADTPPD